MKKRQMTKVFAIMAALMLVSITTMEQTAHARAGSSRSMGSRGSRSYSPRQAMPYSQPSPSRPQMAPSPSPFQQQGGGFFRNMAGGIAGGLLGGMLGGMLFRSMGFAGAGGMGGGIGIFEILLLAGIAYLIYRFVKKQRAERTPVYSGEPHRDSRSTTVSDAYVVNQPEFGGPDAGLSHVRQMDPSFDERRFKDSVMDIFFKIQGGWMNRDMAAMGGLLTDEMKAEFQEEMDRLRRNRQINRLENIAVRNVEISEVWQESGQDYITTLIYANLLDYTTDDSTGAVVAGSKTEPVKFEEYWTFTRPVGNNGWRLSAITQG